MNFRMQYLKPFYLLLLSLFSIQLGVAQKRNFEQELKTLAEKHEAVGLTVLVVKNGKPIYEKAIGYKDLENKTALSTKDLFRIASISKSFSATAIMQLVEQGKISLDDDFSDLIGFKVRNPKFPDTKITLEMVLSHRSSINDSNGYFSLDVLDPSKNEKWEKSYNNYEPGKGYAYCNLNFNMVGAVLERLTNVRFDSYIKQQILNPLKLAAGYCIDSLDSRRFVKLYELENGSFKEQPSAYNPRSEEIKNYVMGESTPVFSPTGGMKISTKDLARYMMMHMNYGRLGKVKIIEEASSKRMQKGLTEKEKYGLALLENTNLIAREHMVGHTGSAYGLYSNMFFEPEKKFGFIVITNGCRPTYVADGDALNFSKEVINLLYRNFIIK
ncbi:serine hydrolase domain-containing protein [Sphingobacterium lactis]|uniref:serine hydrolase domain-containing protein n=1 Tax=Sphingobacterium lactis TaxID=797291 RepID=UPI003F815FFF